MQVTYTRPPRGHGGLYVIKLSDRHYYGGSTKSFQIRWAEHLRTLKNGTHKNPHMQAVFNQHQHFEPVVLEGIQDFMVRLASEQVWLNDHFGKPGCVNILSEAEVPPMQGRTHTGESRRKMSKAHLGRKLSEDHRRSLSEAQKLRHQENPMTEETRQKIVLGNRGKKRPYTAERNRVRTGWNHSPEALAKISDAGRRPCTIEIRAKISTALKSKGIRPPGFGGRRHTGESRRKMSESSKGPRTMSPEERTRRSEAAKEFWRKRKGGS